MINADILGRFVWHELMTTDADAAGEFYPQVTGWEAQSWENDPSYTLWMSPEGPMGGVMSLPGDDEETETPPHWLPYIGTADIDATVEAAQRLGGRVEKDITDVASIGRFAVLSDPQGALFAVLEPAEDSSGGASASGGTPPVGGFSWHELATSDYEAAFQFYQELFGWEKDAAHEMGGDLGTYLMFSNGGAQVGGMYNKPPDAPSSWLCYVRVKAAADAAEAAKAAGGQVAHGPMEVPGGDVVAQIIDPQGAMFAVHERKQAADAGKPAKPKRSKKKKPVEEAVLAEEAAVESTPAPAMEEDEEAEAEEVSARPARKSAAKSRSSAKPAAAKAKGGGGKKTAGKKAAAKKAPAKKAPARKAPARKAPAKKAAGKKAVAKAPARKGAKKSAGTRSAVARSKGAAGRSAQTSRTKSAASKRPAARKGAARKKR